MPFEQTAPGADAPTGAPAPPPPPSGPPTADPAPDGPTRRRRNRSWSTPTAGTVESFERPLTDRDWARSKPSSPPAVPVEPAVAPSADEPQDVATLLSELRSDVAALRAELAAERDKADPTLVTGAELAASIEALGTTLGTGLASLLTEHRSLLARDVEGAAARILEELGERLRASGTLTIDAVEERVRHISAKGLGDLSEQLDLRLDQLEADVSGLRAVMLEIPDQTQVVDRLDHLADSIGPARSDDSDALAALTREITALRRRIALRPDAVQPDEDEAPDEVVARDDASATAPRLSSPRAARAPRPPRTAKAAGIRIEDEAPPTRAKRPARKAAPKR
jgi:hypothetical protein